MEETKDALNHNIEVEVVIQQKTNDKLSRQEKEMLRSKRNSTAAFYGLTSRRTDSEVQMATDMHSLEQRTISQKND